MDGPDTIAPDAWVQFKCTVNTHGQQVEIKWQVTLGDEELGTTTPARNSGGSQRQISFKSYRYI